MLGINVLSLGNLVNFVKFMEKNNIFWDKMKCLVWVVIFCCIWVNNGYVL